MLDLKQAIWQCGLVVERKAKIKCPVDTGYLRSSITTESTNTEASVYTNVEYAPYVEYGTGLYAEAGDGRKTPWKYQTADGTWHTTKGQNPQPFLRPALDESIDEIAEIIAEGVAENVSTIFDSYSTE